MHFTISLTVLKHKKCAIRQQHMTLLLWRLLQNIGHICGMMIIMIMIMVRTNLLMMMMMMMKENFLSGMMDIGLIRLKKPQQKKSSYPLLGIHQGGRIGVCQKMKNKG